MNSNAAATNRIDQVVHVDELAGRSGHLASTIEADLAFCHPDIIAVESVDTDRGDVRVSLDPGGDSDPEEIARLVRAVVALSVKSHRLADPGPPVWKHASRGGANAAALQTFIERHVRPLGAGRFALLGAAADARVAVDARLRHLAVELGAETWHLPSIEDTADLIPRTGYFASHPQHVTFGYRVPCHFDALERFAQAARSAPITAPAPEHGPIPTGFILEPFVCHNVYLALKNRRLCENLAVTALGNCYRYEGFRFRPLVRQWEFSMRELVLVGQPAYVDEKRQVAERKTQGLVEAWDLDATLEVATDPFFVVGAEAARTYQVARTTKMELRACLGGRDTTALASFNSHGRHFTEPMDIRGAARDALLETACIGWGIERWIAALACRWGAQTDRWPL